MPSARRYLPACLLVTTLQACGGGGAQSLLPAPPIAAFEFGGGSVDDVWALGLDQGMAHWDGSTWSAASESGPPSPRGTPATVTLVGGPFESDRLGEVVIAPGQLLVADADGVLALDRDGAAVEDYGLPSELQGADHSWLQLVTNGTAHFGLARLNADPPTQHLFRYQDGVWTDLEAPQDVANFRVSADGRVIAQLEGVWGFLWYADGSWSESSYGPEGLPSFIGDTVALATGATGADLDLTVRVEWLEGGSWTEDTLPAGKAGGNEVFLSFTPVSVQGAPAVRYARRRVSGSNRFIEYGYLTLKDDLTFDARRPLVESENVCSTACVGESEDRTTAIWSLADGSAVYFITVKPGDDDGASSYYVVDAP